MDNKPPVLGTQIPSFPTPDITDVVLAEFHDTRTADYVAVDYGTAHPDTARYPNHILTFQGPVDTAGNYVRRVYVNDRSDQDAYNFVISYAHEDINYPIYARSYIIREEDYVAIAPGTADPDSGPGVLVEQRCLESTGTPEIDSEYIKVVRIYEVLPGPWVPFTRYDELRGPIQGRRRDVLRNDAAQAATRTATAETTYSARGESAIVSVQLEETNGDGTGSSGNPAFPITVSNASVSDRGDVETTTQLSTDITTDSSLVIGTRVASGPLTSATGVPLKPVTGITISNRGTGMLPTTDGPTDLVLGGGTFSTAGRVSVLTTRVVSASLVDGGDGFAPTGSAYVVTMVGTTGTGSRVTIALNVGSGGGIMGLSSIVTPGSYTENPANLAAEPLFTAGLVGDPPTVLIQMGVDTFDLYTLGSYTVGPATFTSTGGGDNATFTNAEYTVAAAVQTQWEPVNEYLRKKVVSKWALPGPTLRSGEQYDTELGLVTATKQLVDGTSGATQSESASGRTRYEATSYGNPVLWKIVESWVTADFPTLDADFYDRELGAVARDTILTIDTSTAGSESSSTRVTYEPRNDYLRKKVTDTWVPANFPTVQENLYDRERGAIKRTTILTIDLTTVGSLSASTNLVTEIRYEPRNAYLRKLVTETFAYPGPEIVSEPEIDRDGAVFTIKRQLDVASNILEGESNSGGLTIITSEPYSGQTTGPLRWKITKTRALPGTAWTRAEVDGETGTAVSISMQIIATPSFPLTQTTGSEVAYQPLSSVHGLKITTSLVGYASVTVVDYPTGKMTAPALITNAVLTSATARDGTPAISIVWTKRAAKTREVKMTRTRSYGSQSDMQTARNALTLENPGVIDLIRDPIFLPAIREANVLTDAKTLGPYTTGTENPKWPYLTESVSWGATTPSASGYPGRTNVVLSAVVEYWKYNLWRLTKVQADTF